MSLRPCIVFPLAFFGIPLFPLDRSSSNTERAQPALHRARERGKEQKGRREKEDCELSIDLGRLVRKTRQSYCWRMHSVAGPRGSSFLLADLRQLERLQSRARQTSSLRASHESDSSAPALKKKQKQRREEEVFLKKFREKARERDSRRGFLLFPPRRERENAKEAWSSLGGSVLLSG